MEADRPQNALSLPRILAKKKKPKIDWLLTLSDACMVPERMKEAGRIIDPAAVLIELDRKKAAETVMARSDLGEAALSPDFRYRGAAPRLSPRRPRQALPILER